MESSTSPTGEMPELSRRGFLSGAGALLAAGASGVVLSGCGGAQSSSGGMDKVTFLNVLPLESLTFTPELIADTHGFFREQRLQADFQVTRGSPQAIQLILSGNAPLTRIGDIETMQAIAEKNAPLVNLGTLMKEAPLRFVSSRNAPLVRPQDFVGKTIGTPSAGGTSETTMNLMLAAAGVDYHSVPRQVVGLAPGVFNLVKSGRIAAYLVSLDTAIELQRQEPEAVVFDPGSVVTSGAQLYATSRPTLEKQRDLIQRYMRAIKSAVDFVIADESLDETLRLMRSKYHFQTLDNTDVAKNALREYVKLYTADGKDNVLKTKPERWQRSYEEMTTADVVKKGLQPGDWLVNDLI
jgi:NitT/TauT family transport system substrate-binding protein